MSLEPCKFDRLVYTCAMPICSGHCRIEDIVNSSDRPGFRIGRQACSYQVWKSVGSYVFCKFISFWKSSFNELNGHRKIERIQTQKTETRRMFQVCKEYKSASWQQEASSITRRLQMTPTARGLFIRHCGECVHKASHHFQFLFAICVVVANAESLS